MSELSQLLDEKPDEQEEEETLPEEVTRRPVAWYRREYFGFPVWLYAAGIAALAAVLVWVLSDDSVTAPQTGSFLMEEPAEPAPLLPAASAQQAAPAPLPPAISSPSVSAVELQDVRAYAEANREAITRLAGRVEQQSLRLAEQQRHLEALAKSGAAVSTDKRPTTALPPAPDAALVRSGTTRKPSVKKAPETGQRGPAVATKDVQLISIASGMAWVKWQDKTWAVIPGDRLGSLTIRRIDTAERVVHTSAGIIR
ncbi:TPA: hypothetical protein LLS83_005849 [Klebsiella michiganensis]|nr:hypothetical protein [Klebsiella michiganensis]